MVYKMKKGAKQTLSDFIKRKKSVVTVKSKQFSFLISVIIALSYKSKRYDIQPSQIKNQPKQHFKELTEKLCADATSYLGFKPTRIKEWRTFLKHLGFDLIIFCANSHYRIVNENVISTNSQGQKLFLLRSQGEFGKKYHYDFVRKPNGYFEKFLCNLCFKRSKSKQNHLCKFKCYMCKSHKRHDRQFESTIRMHMCTKCNRYFYSRSCKDLHIKNKICDRKKICLKCDKLYVMKKTKEHKCYAKNYCMSCKCIHPEHKHFIKSGFSPPDNFSHLLVFDFETFNDTKNYVTPYLCVSRLYNIENIFDYSNPNFEPKDCSFTEKIFFGLNCSKDFFLYLTSGLLPKGTVCVAHNGQKFDFYFVLKYFYQTKYFIPSLVINGTLIMQMTVKTKNVELRFIDSVNFIPAPLRKFPTLFGFSDSKTYFPYSFVNENTIDYIGEIPSKSYYDVGLSDTDDFEKFYHDYNNEQLWSLQNVSTDYCIQDVHVLFCGIFTYMRTFYQAAKINPFA